MWCDNCLLLFPLRAGAMIWAVFILLYSIAGGILLLEEGQYWFFVYPEWKIYGGLSLGVALFALITIIALSNNSWVWTRVAFKMWPFVLVICSIRAVIMIVELQRGKSKIEWECANGGQLWTASVEAGYGSATSTVPSAFCSGGFSSLNAGFIVGLLVDLGFQLYMFFLIWRYQKRLEHYSGLKPTTTGDYYS